MMYSIWYASQVYLEETYLHQKFTKLIFIGLETHNETVKGLIYSLYFYIEKLFYVIIVLLLDYSSQTQLSLIICLHFAVSVSWVTFLSTSL